MIASPFATADSHDVPRLIDEFIPGLAAATGDAVGYEHAVEELIISRELPDVLDRV